MSVKLWTPTPIWEGEPCYILGGGPSLETFDWSLLKGHHVIGCNAECYSSPALVPWVVFGDAVFLSRHEAALKKYVARGGQVVTSSNRFREPREKPEWLKVMKKENQGLSLEGLGWNGNTGSSAINLALLFGASPVYLLGFDMQLIDGKANHHDAYHRKANPKAYARFLKKFEFLARDLPKLFPGKRIINLEDGTSKLNLFPKESLKEHFKLAAVGGTHG